MVEFWIILPSLRVTVYTVSSSWIKLIWGVTTLQLHFAHLLFNDPLIVWVNSFLQIGHLFIILHLLIYLLAVLKNSISSSGQLASISSTVMQYLFTFKSSSTDIFLCASFALVIFVLTVSLIL